MARPPRVPNARPRREDILDHATRLFAERGYEGTSMGDLAEVVGMRKASLFYHFASKDELYAAVLERLIGAFGAVIVAAASAEGSFAERLDNLSDAMTTTLGAQRFAARILIREAMDWGPVIRGQLSESIQTVLGAAEQFLRAGQEAGVFAEADAKQQMITLVGIHFMPFGIGRVVEGFIGKDPFDPAFVEARRLAVRDEVRRMVLAKRPAK